MEKDISSGVGGLFGGALNGTWSVGTATVYIPSPALATAGVVPGVVGGGVVVYGPADTSVGGGNNSNDDNSYSDDDNNDNSSGGSGSPNWDAIEGMPGYGNPTSQPVYGHSVNTHGSQRPGYQLADRARGRVEQGQWYDDQSIVEAEILTRDIGWQRWQQLGDLVTDFNMNRPIGRVYLPDGRIVENVTWVRVRRTQSGTLRTSFPIRPPH